MNTLNRNQIIGIVLLVVGALALAGNLGWLLVPFKYVFKFAFPARPRRQHPAGRPGPVARQRPGTPPFTRQTP